MRLCATRLQNARSVCVQHAGRRFGRFWPIAVGQAPKRRPRASISRSGVALPANHPPRPALTARESAWRAPIGRLQRRAGGSAPIARRDATLHLPAMVGLLGRMVGTVLACSIARCRRSGWSRARSVGCRTIGRGGRSTARHARTHRRGAVRCRFRAVAKPSSHHPKSSASKNHHYPSAPPRPESRKHVPGVGKFFGALDYWCWDWCCCVRAGRAGAKSREAFLGPGNFSGKRNMGAEIWWCCDGALRHEGGGRARCVWSGRKVFAGEVAQKVARWRDRIECRPVRRDFVYEDADVGDARKPCAETA